MADYGAAVRARRALIAKRKRRARLPKPPTPLHPDGIIRQYKLALRGPLALMRKLLSERLKPRLQDLVAAVSRSRPDPTRLDDASDDFVELMGGIRAEFETAYSDEELKRLARVYGVKTSEFQQSQWARSLKRVIGVDVFAYEPWLSQQLAIFALDNVSLIGSVTDRTFDEIEQGIMRGFRTGVRWEELSSFVDERLSVCANRADLIARDQIGKLNGQLTGLRQQNLGVKRAIWRTSKDERVRESHREMEGEVFDWDDPPVVDDEATTPGEPINCRCWAEPVFEDLDPASGAGDNED